MSNAFKSVKKKVKNVLHNPVSAVEKEVGSVKRETKRAWKDYDKTNRKDVTAGTMDVVTSFTDEMQPDTPAPAETKAAPISDAEAEARASSRTRQRMKRSGRTSTVLTSGSSLG